jgi:hypothetical protein
MSAEGARFLHAPIEWGGAKIDTGELLEPVSELGIANLGVYEKIMSGKAIDSTPEVGEHIVLGDG